MKLIYDSSEFFEGAPRRGIWFGFFSVASKMLNYISGAKISTRGMSAGIAGAISSALAASRVPLAVKYGVVRMIHSSRCVGVKGCYYEH